MKKKLLIMLFSIGILIPVYGNDEDQDDSAFCVMDYQSKVTANLFNEKVNTKTPQLEVRIIDEKITVENPEQILIEAKIKWVNQTLSVPSSLGDVWNMLGNAQKKINRAAGKNELEIKWNIMGFTSIDKDQDLEDLEEIHSDIKKDQFIIEKDPGKIDTEKSSPAIHFYAKRKEEDYEILVKFSSNETPTLAKQITIGKFENIHELKIKNDSLESADKAIFAVSFEPALSLEDKNISDFKLEFDSCPKTLECEETAKLNFSEDKKTLKIEIPKHNFEDFSASLIIKDKDTLLKNRKLEIKGKNVLSLDLDYNWGDSIVALDATLSDDSLEGKFSWHCQEEKADLETSKPNLDSILKSTCDGEQTNSNGKSQFELDNDFSGKFHVIAQFKSDDGKHTVTSDTLVVSAPELQLTGNKDDNNIIQFNTTFNKKEIAQEDLEFEVICKAQVEVASKPIQEQGKKEEDEDKPEQAKADEKTNTPVFELQVVKCEHEIHLETTPKTVSIPVRPTDLIVTLKATMKSNNQEATLDIELPKSQKIEFDIFSQKENSVAENKEDGEKDEGDSETLSPKVKVGNQTINLAEGKDLPDMNFYDDDKKLITDPKRQKDLKSLVSKDGDNLKINRPEAGKDGFYIGFPYSGTESELYRVNPKRNYRLVLKQLGMDQISKWEHYEAKVPFRANGPIKPPVGEEKLTTEDDINGEKKEELAKDDAKDGKDLEVQYGYCAFQVVDGAYPINIEDGLKDQSGYDYDKDGWDFNVADCVAAGNYDEHWNETLGNNDNAKNKHVYICKIPRLQNEPRFITAKLTNEQLTDLSDEEKNQEEICTVEPINKRPSPFDFAGGPGGMLPQVPSMGRLPRVHIGLNLI